MLLTNPPAIFALLATSSLCTFDLKNRWSDKWNPSVLNYSTCFLSICCTIVACIISGLYASFKASGDPQSGVTMCLLCILTLCCFFSVAYS